VNCLAWTPEGRRLVAASATGEFTLWNGSAFNFETILQAHDTAIHALHWSHNRLWMVSCDHIGTVKYWQSNMNMVKEFSAHKEAIRGMSFAPGDAKFATCSDDVTVRIWDFARCTSDHVLTGHGWDVKALDWHPHSSVLASAGKDNLIKLWDARSGADVATMHGHRNTIAKCSWNANGRHLLTCGRDQALKLFDVRVMRCVTNFVGHARDINSIAWHPDHTRMFASGGYDGTIFHWSMDDDKPIATTYEAHEGAVLALAWFPLGHVLSSGSHDQTVRFWCRNRPGDAIDDKHNGFGRFNETQAVITDPNAAAHMARQQALLAEQQAYAARRAAGERPKRPFPGSAGAQHYQQQEQRMQQQQQHQQQHYQSQQQQPSANDPEKERIQQQILAQLEQAKRARMDGQQAAAASLQPRR
jgi:polyadenylation factor subunit 2